MITLSLSLKLFQRAVENGVLFISFFFFLNLKLCILSPSFLFDYTLWLVHGLNRFLLSCSFSFFFFFFSFLFFLFFLILKRYVTRSSFSFVVCDFILINLHKGGTRTVSSLSFLTCNWISKNRMILNNSKTNSHNYTITNMLSIDYYQNINRVFSSLSSYIGDKRVYV